MIGKEQRFEVKPVNGPGSPGALFVEGERVNVNRTYDPPLAPNFALLPGDQIVYDANGLPVAIRAVAVNPWPAGVPNGSTAPASPGHGHAQARAAGNGANPATPAGSGPSLRLLLLPVGQVQAENALSVASSSQQLADDVQAVERQNSETRNSNERVTATLRSVTGRDQPADRETWAAWWADQQGYAYQSDVPAVKETIEVSVSPAFVPSGYVSPVSPDHMSCFAAGTPVKTLVGPRAIETLRVGNLVLTQDAAAGTLSFQPVLATFHNKPAPIFKVAFDKETIAATGIHRFWRVGQGWVMARDLKPGDRVRTLDGASEIVGVETGPVVPVFNLEVARGKSFFVGKAGALVHDNSLVLPVTAPFDAPGLAAARP